MEIEIWAVLIKSLARNQQTLISASVSNLSYIAAYLLALWIVPTRQLRLSFLCLLASMVVSRSLIYDMLSGYQLHITYSIIYLFAVPYMKKLQVMVAVFVMASFNCVMALDAYSYAYTETYLFVHYESITTLLHVVVITSSINWRRVAAITNSAASRLLSICSCSSCFLHIRHLLRYNKEEENNRKHQKCQKVTSGF